jgi:hypothetical protein
MLINVTSTDQTIDIFISDGELQSVIVGDRGIGSPKRAGGRDMVSRKFFNYYGLRYNISCILDAFYDNLKATDLVYLCHR